MLLPTRAPVRAEGAPSTNASAYAVLVGSLAWGSFFCNPQRPLRGLKSKNREAWNGIERRGETAARKCVEDEVLIPGDVEHS